MKTFATYQLYQIMNENKGIKSYKDKNTFSAIVVYWDGSCYWVAELLGFFSQNSTSSTAAATAQALNGMGSHSIYWSSNSFPARPLAPVTKKTGRIH